MIYNVIESCIQSYEFLSKLTTLVSIDTSIKQDATLDNAYTLLQVLLNRTNGMDEALWYLFMAVFIALHKMIENIHLNSLKEYDLE